jgi:hypothetical protein
MIICPVCDHVQPEGTECDVCGRAFPKGTQPATAPVAPLPELELTQIQGGRAPVEAPALPDLDLTRQKAGPDLPAQVVQDLELTRTGDPGAVPVEQLMDLDTGRAPDDGVRTAAPTGSVMCRYCRNVQAQGLLCDRCGMRLPRARVAAPAATAKGRTGEDDVWLDCTMCHTPVRPGKVCSECGTRARAEA